VQSDHAGALTEILEEFDVGEVWLPDGPCACDEAKRILAIARERNVPVRFASRESTSTTAQADPTSAHVDILCPPRGAAACNDNNQSLVMALAFAGRRVLFTG